MLIARAVTRAEIAWFRPDLYFDLVLARARSSAGSSSGSAPKRPNHAPRRGYRIARAHPRREDHGARPSRRLAKVSAAGGANPVLLTDAAGTVRAKRGNRLRAFASRSTDRPSTCDRRSAYALRFDLFSGTSPRPIGSVGRTTRCRRRSCRNARQGSAKRPRFLIALVADAAKRDQSDRLLPTGEGASACIALPVKHIVEPPFEPRKPSHAPPLFRPRVRNGARAVPRHRRSSRDPDDERDRLLLPKRAIAVSCPIHMDDGRTAGVSPATGSSIT